MIVVDSNVIVYCWVRGEHTAFAQRVRHRDPAWHVPIVWRSEFRSALAGHMRRGTFDLQRAARIMAIVESEFEGCEHKVPSDVVLELAARTTLSAYDCEFVALAQSLRVPLLTEDKAILKAFPDVALTMEGFLARFQYARRKDDRGARYRELLARIDAEPRPAGKQLPKETREQLYERLLSEKSPKR